MADAVSIKKTETLSKEKHTLKRITFERKDQNGNVQQHTNEVYDMGDAATVLLYNAQQKKIILTKQFRLPSYLNGNKTGMLIEACAGKIENETAEESIVREIEEETGYKVPAVKKIFDAYTSPGTITELLHFFIAEYNSSMKVSNGGGLKDEKEDIEVMEIFFYEAIKKIENGEIKDAKTIMLLLYAKAYLP
jgi:nudix-type nucleoside diphosphatase (YffH/AdpP family)